jgi:ribosomal protein L16 Arg81 hydroxylase
MISTLGNLIAPLSEAEFLAHFRDGTVAFVRSPEPSRFASLLDWDELNHLLESGLYPIEELRVRHSVPVPTTAYMKQGQLDGAAFSSLMDQGAGLIFTRLDRYSSKVCKLCQQIAEQTLEQISAEAVVTGGMNDVRQHVNTEDTFVLQVIGSSRWELYRAPVSPAPKCTPLFSETLRMGDFLFVPAGFGHRCENGSGRSLHVCIVSEPPRGRDVVTWLVNRLATDETFNGPLTRYADASALGAHENALKARLIEQVQAWSLSNFLAERAASRSGRVGVLIQGNQIAAEGSKAKRYGVCISDAHAASASERVIRGRGG